MPTETWYLVREEDLDGTTVEAAADDALKEVTVRDSITAFANKADVLLDDPDAEKPEQYPRPTVVELYVEVPGTLDLTRRFAGFVQDHSTDRNECELSILSHDFWIKHATGIYATYEEETVSAILKDLIETYTPLIWNPALVEVENDETISREWAGEALESILEELQTVSGGEEFFGATYDREFQWQPLEDEAAPRTFEEGEYISTEWNEDGKHAANRAVIRYGEGEDEGVVAENNRAAQRELQQALGADRPVEIPIQENRTEITSEERAHAKAEQLLDERSQLESGTLETWEALDVEPGQLTTVVDPSQDVDDEVRVVQINYNWPGGDPPTEITVANSKMDTVDELVSLTDTVQRVDLADASADAEFLEAITEHSGATLETTASVTARVFGDGRFAPGFGRGELGFGRGEAGVSIERVDSVTSISGRATNTALDTIRDVWLGDSTPPRVREMRVGDGESRPSRTDTELENVVQTYDAGIIPGMTTAYWSTTLRPGVSGTWSEVGVSDDGDLFARALIEEIDVPTDAFVEINLRISIDNDDDLWGVITARGAAAARDALVDDNPATPSLLAFGVGQSDADIGDQALDDEIARIGVERLRSRGTGRAEVGARLLEDDASGAEIAEFGQIDGNGELLTRVAFSAIELTGIDLEASNLTRFSND